MTAAAPFQRSTARGTVTEKTRLHTNSQTLSLSFESSLIQSCMRLEAPDELVLDYTRAMMAFLLLHPEPRAILMIGLGGGSMAKYMHRHLPSADLTVAEIHPEVIALRDDFQIPRDSERFRVLLIDGAKHVRPLRQQYDVILVDGFTGEGLPQALCSRSFYASCREALRPEGTLVANVQADTARTREVLQRLRQAFSGGMVAVESMEGGNEIAFAAAPGVLHAAQNAFDARWAALPPAHQETLAACSSRLQRALMKLHRPITPN